MKYTLAVATALTLLIVILMSGLATDRSALALRQQGQIRLADIPLNRAVHATLPFNSQAPLVLQFPVNGCAFALTEVSGIPAGPYGLCNARMYLDINGVLAAAPYIQAPGISGLAYHFNPPVLMMPGDVVTITWEFNPSICALYPPASPSNVFTVGGWLLLPGEL